MTQGYDQLGVPEAANWILVGLEELHIVHVGLPVLNKTSCVACHHPLVVMRPHHRPHTAVMGLGKDQGIVLKKVDF